MNITFVDFAGPYFPGGCEKYFSVLAKYFSKDNKTTFLHSKQYVSFMERIYFLLSKHKIGSIDYTKRDLGKCKVNNLSILGLIPLTRERNKINSILNNSDVIYTKNEFQELLYLYLTLGQKKYSEKVVVGVHSSIFIPDSVRGIWKIIHDFQYKSIIYKIFMRNARKIHIINKGYVEKIINYYGVKQKNIVYIPYFIDWDTRLTNSNNSKINLLWAGRYTLQKGLDRLTHIIDKLAKDKTFKKINILIAGAGECKSIVTNLTKKHKNITDIGYQHNMEEIYPKINLGLVTSYFETFGYNVLEPQSFGIPVISYQIDGPSDIIINNKTGYLAKTDDDFVDKCSLAINQLLGSKRQLLPNQKIFENIHNRFSKPVIMRQLSDEIFVKTSTTNVK